MPEMVDEVDTLCAEFIAYELAACAYYLESSGGWNTDALNARSRRCHELAERLRYLYECWEDARGAALWERIRDRWVQVK